MGLLFPQRRHQLCEPACKRAFTLVELLVVIAVIAVLMAILVPVMAKARAQSRFVSCKVNLRLLLHAHVAYAQDFRGAKPPLFRKGASSIRVDWVSPDIKWSNTPVGQGILVALKYVSLNALMDPSEGMTEDVARDRLGWSSFSNSGSSYAYFFRHPIDAPPGLANACVNATYSHDRVNKRMALIMDLNAEVGHSYVGEYSGRTWISHPLTKRVNVAYLDGSVVDFALNEVQLKFPAESADELAWFDVASSKKR
jgi:prepilin-type N-terminal cleavage/methylation domain-containing protein/prepilin-type processing-associated H-X9-DG protein